MIELIFIFKELKLYDYLVHFNVDFDLNTAIFYGFGGLVFGNRDNNKGFEVFSRMTKYF